MPDEPDPLLTGVQRRTVASAITLFAILASLALIIAALVILGRLAGFFSGVLWPIAVAGILALVLRPLVVIIEQRVRVRRIAAVVMLYVTFLGAVTILVWLIMPPVIDQLLRLIADAPTMGRSMYNWMLTRYPEWAALWDEQMTRPGVQRIADTVVEQVQEMMANTLPSLRAAGGGIIQVFAFFTHLAIVPVYLFFFLLSRADPAKKLRVHLPFLPEELRDDVIFLVREFIAIIETFFRGQLVIGLIMGVLLAIGFTIIGLDYGLLLGIALGVLNIIPYLGTIVGLAVALPLAFFQDEGGGWTMVGLVLLVKIIVQAIESWILTPKIMGQRTGLHPAVIIFAVFFWGTAFGGVVGMLFAIPLTAFFVTAWRLFSTKYLWRPE